MRGLGRGIKEFKEGVKEVTNEVNNPIVEETDKSSSSSEGK